MTKSTSESITKRLEMNLMDLQGEDQRMSRWMVRARYSEVNASESFKRRNNFQEGQWLYLKNTSFTNMERGSLYVKLSTAQGAWTRTFNWAEEAGYTHPVDMETVMVKQVDIVIPAVQTREYGY